MFSAGGEGNSFFINFDWVCSFCKYRRKRSLFIKEGLEHSFLSRERDMVSAAEDLGELKNVEKIDDVVAHKNGVIRLANGRDGEVSKLGAQAGVLSYRELLLREDFIQV